MNGHNDESVDGEGSLAGARVQTVQMKPRSAGALLTLGFASFLLVTTGGTRVLSQAVQSTTSPATPLEAADVYASYGHASALLQQGYAQGAGSILDKTRPESLIVEARATSDGVLADQSAMVLLMQLVRRIGNQAVRAAQAGDQAEAQSWLRRGWRISDQVAATSRPGVGALMVAHFADCHLSQVQARVARLAGNTAAEQVALAHKASLTDVWFRLIAPQLHQAQIGIASADTEDTAQMYTLRDHYSLYRLKVGAGARINQV